MATDSPTASRRPVNVRVFGIGDAGLSVINTLIAGGSSPEAFVAINTGGPELEKSAASKRVCLESRRLRGLGSGGDPERGRQAAEDKLDELKDLCQGVDLVLLVAGLGGGAGTGISPVLARAAKSAGALVLGFVSTPFNCEGDRRADLAAEGLEGLRSCVDGVVCLHNEKIFGLIDQNTTAVDTFRICNRFLADGVLSLWRILTSKGLIEVHLEDVCRLLQDRHFESVFAVSEAVGPERVPLVIDKLLAHPMLDNGQALAESEAVLVSLTAGPNLTMAEVNRITEQIKTRCGTAKLMMGACVDEQFEDRLVVTLIAAKRVDHEDGPRVRQDGFDTQLLQRNLTVKPGSRFLPPAPTLPPEQVQQLLARQNTGRQKPPIRKSSAKLRQGQLPLEIVSKGRFDNSEPTIYKGEDLDVPTYIRRGIPLN